MRKTMRILSEIFIPIVPVIAATGLFLGLKVLFLTILIIRSKCANIPESFQQIVSVITDTVFAFCQL